MNYRYLCYVRPGYEFQFRDIVASAGLLNETIFVSDFKVLKKLDWVQYLNFEEWDGSQGLLDTESDEVIARCRLLRVLPKNEAKLMLNATYGTFVALLEKHDIKNVISLCVDSYVGDTLRIAINQRNGSFNGIVVSFIQGYFRLTQQGEHYTNREVQDEEVDQVYEKISKNINRSHFLPKVKRSAISRSKEELNSIFKDILRYQYYWWKEQLGVENNYHVKVNSIGLSGIPPVFNGHERYVREFSRTSKLQIYLPLQVSPEATIDYWSSSLDSIDYEAYIESVIKNLPGAEIVIKENPSPYVRRPFDFYKRLDSYENVVFVDMNIDSSYLLQQCDAALTVTGSVGIEAVIHGKPAIILGNPYYEYDDVEFFFTCNRIPSASEVTEFIELFSQSDIALNSEYRLDAQKGFVRKVLSGMIKGDFRLPKRNKAGKWEYDKDSAVEVGKALSTILRQL